MTDARIPATHPAAVTARILQDITSACAFVARDESFDSAQELRVALRRLRSGLTLFRPLLPGDQGKALLEEARWFSAEVTRLRDLYLLAQDTLTPARVALPNNAALAALETQATEQTTRERENIRSLIEGARGQAFLAAVAEMSDPAYWRPAAADPEKVEALCNDTLEQRLAQALKYGENLKRLDPNVRDAFRKSLRKLRATAEISQMLFASKKTKAFLKQLKKLLESMTAARDASAVRDTLQALTKRSTGDDPVRHIAQELIKVKERGGTLDSKRLQSMWRATTALPLY